jgi:hypothetical protein
MSKIIDVKKVQEALDRAAISDNRAGRFSLKTNMPSIGSSILKEIDYDEASQELEITFVTGRTYRYSKVPQEIYHTLMSAASKGAFFNSHIRDAFPYRAVTSR